MSNKSATKLKKICVAVALLCSQNVFSASNFNITLSGTYPATVTTGQTVSAYYTVTNMTHSARNGYALQGLPTTVTQNTASPNCTNPINLEPSQSCRLQLDITGAVSSNIAICRGNSCAMSNTPLNVKQTNYSNFIYVSDRSNVWWQCPVNNITGETSGSCISLTNTTPPSFSTIYSATFETFSGVTYAYVADASNNLWQCPMNSTGGISGGACAALINNNASGFNQIQATTFAIFSGVTYAYVADSSNTLWQCPMNSTGGIISSTCNSLLNNTLPYFAYTNNTTFATFAGVTYAYVADGSNNLWQCPMNATGGISNSFCNLLSSAFYSINDITFATFSGVTYAYVADNTSNLWQCPMNTTGGINGSCTALTNSTPNGFNLTTDTRFATLSGVTYAYVSDQSSVLWQCPMSTTGGIIGNACTALTNSTSPYFANTSGAMFFAP